MNYSEATTGGVLWKNFAIFTGKLQNICREKYVMETINNNIEISRCFANGQAEIQLE